MYEKCICSTILILSVATRVHGYASGGQNLIACYDMTPRHGNNKPNYTTSNFQIYVGELGYNDGFVTYQPISGKNAC
jgi:hypothetical protein